MPVHMQAHVHTEQWQELDEQLAAWQARGRDALERTTGFPATSLDLLPYLELDDPARGLGRQGSSDVCRVVLSVTPEMPGAPEGVRVCIFAGSLPDLHSPGGPCKLSVLARACSSVI